MATAAIRTLKRLWCLRNGLGPQLSLVHYEGHLLHAEDVPALKWWDYDCYWLDPASLQVAAAIRGHDQTNEVLD